jgi:hypothetical protein
MASYSYTTELPESFGVNTIGDRFSCMYFPTTDKNVNEETIFNVLDSLDYGDENGRLLAHKIALAIETVGSIPNHILDVFIAAVMFNRDVDTMEYANVYKLIEKVVIEHDNSN